MAHNDWFLWYKPPWLPTTQRIFFMGNEYSNDWRRLSYSLSLKHMSRFVNIQHVMPCWTRWMYFVGVTTCGAVSIRRGVSVTRLNVSICVRSHTNCVITKDDPTFTCDRWDHVYFTVTFMFVYLLQFLTILSVVREMMRVEFSSVCSVIDALTFTTAHKVQEYDGVIHSFMIQLFFHCCKK